MTYPSHGVRPRRSLTHFQPVEMLRKVSLSFVFSCNEVAGFHVWILRQIFWQKLKGITVLLGYSDGRLQKYWHPLLKRIDRYIDKHKNDILTLNL